MFGAVQLLGKLKHEYVKSIARGAQREPQRSRRLALAVARIDLNLADFQRCHLCPFVLGVGLSPSWLGILENIINPSRWSSSRWRWMTINVDGI